MRLKLPNQFSYDAIRLKKLHQRKELDFSRREKRRCGGVNLQ
jgi:hypothetical protein